MPATFKPATTRPVPKCDRSPLLPIHPHGGTWNGGTHAHAGPHGLQPCAGSINPA